MKDLTQTERGKTISFFNELEIKKPCSSLVSFFNELEIRKSCSKTSVSFFNEVASEMKKLSSKPLFHFLNEVSTET